MAFNGARSHASPSGDFTSYHYLSSDNGNKWEEISDNTFTSEWESVVCSDGSILQAGWGTINYSNNDPSETWLVARSVDRGCTWTSTGISGTSASAGGSIGDSYIWAGPKGYALFRSPGSHGFYLSTDNGDTWQPKTVK